MCGVVRVAQEFLRTLLFQECTATVSHTQLRLFFSKSAQPQFTHTTLLFQECTATVHTHNSSFPRVHSHNRPIGLLNRHEAPLVSCCDTHNQQHGHRSPRLSHASPHTEVVLSRQMVSSVLAAIALIACVHAVPTPNDIVPEVPFCSCGLASFRQQPEFEFES